MKCFYHPEKDGVGLCTACSKSACRDCIEDIHGAMLCKGCMVRASQRRDAERDATAAEVQMTREAASDKIRFSRKLFVIAAVLGTFVSAVNAIDVRGDSRQPPLLLALLLAPFIGLGVGYVIWACYWGIPPVWRGWWSMFRRMGCFLIANPFTWLIIIVVLFELPLVAGYLYSVFGGGVYQYKKTKRLTA